MKDNKKKWLQKRWMWILTAIIFIAIPFIINEAYKTPSGYKTIWGANELLLFYGSFLAFVGTVFLGTVTWIQSMKIHKENRELQEKTYINENSVRLSSSYGESVFCKLDVPDPERLGVYNPIAGPYITLFREDERVNTQHFEYFDLVIRVHKYNPPVKVLIRKINVFSTAGTLNFVLGDNTQPIECNTIDDNESDLKVRFALIHCDQDFHNYFGLILASLISEGEMEIYSNFSEIKTVYYFKTKGNLLNEEGSIPKSIKLSEMNSEILNNNQ
jgi:hypothetical protein